MTTPIYHPRPVEETKADVHCAMCTHIVEAKVQFTRKSAWVKPLEKCSRCGGPLDAGYVLRLQRAA